MQYGHSNSVKKGKVNCYIDMFEQWYMADLPSPLGLPGHQSGHGWYSRNVLYYRYSKWMSIFRCIWTPTIQHIITILVSVLFPDGSDRICTKHL